MKEAPAARYSRLICYGGLFNVRSNKIGKQQEVIEVIKALVGQANILTIPRAFIDYTGDINSALLLSQLLYWHDRSSDADHVIYKTYKEWEVELTLTKYQVMRAASILKKKGVLETFVKKAYGNPTVHYQLNVDEFIQQFIQLANFRKLKNFTNESKESRQSLTETTNINSPTTRVPAISEYIRIYKENIGIMTPLIFDSLVELANDFSVKWFQAAVQEACDSNHRNLKYVRAILERWRVEGFRAPKIKEGGRGEQRPRQERAKPITYVKGSGEDLGRKD